MARMGKPSILMVVHDFLPRVVAGTEIHVLRLSAALADRYRVRVFHTVRDTARAQYSTLDACIEGVDTTSVVQHYQYLRETLSRNLDVAHQFVDQMLVAKQVLLRLHLDH